jgi:hypothetical protein
MMTGNLLLRRGITNTVHIVNMIEEKGTATYGFRQFKRFCLI